MTSNLFKNRLWQINTFIIIAFLGILLELPPLELDAQNGEISLFIENSILKPSLGALNGLTIIENNTLGTVLSPLGSEYKIVRRLKVIATAYSSTVWQTDETPFVTAANTLVREGIVANNLLPFGTKVRIPELFGDKIFIVEDRMNWQKGHYQVDIWFPDYWQALNFGAQLTELEIIQQN